MKRTLALTILVLTQVAGSAADSEDVDAGVMAAWRQLPGFKSVGPVRGLVTVEPEDGAKVTYRIDFPAVVLPAASPGG